MTTVQNIIGYSRCSTDGQRDGYGIAIQEDRIRQYAKEKGLPLIELFRDEGVSGAIASRPAIIELMEFAEQNKDKTLGLVFLRLDRLARDLMIQENLLAAFQKCGLEVISIEEPDLCSNDPTRKLFRQIRGSLSEYEKAIITARMSAGRIKKASSGGGYAGGRCAYGFRVEGSDYIPVPSELDTVRDIAGLRRKRKHMSYAGIAKLLNEKGTPAPMGGQWYAATVQKVAQNEFYRGYQRYGSVKLFRPELKIL